MVFLAFVGVFFDALPAEVPRRVQRALRAGLSWTSRSLSLVTPQNSSMRVSSSRSMTRSHASEMKRSMYFGAVVGWWMVERWF